MDLIPKNKGFKGDLPFLDNRSMGIKSEKGLSFLSLKTYNQAINGFNRWVIDKGGKKELIKENLESLIALIKQYVDDTFKVSISRIRKNALKQACLKVFGNNNLEVRTNLLIRFKEIKTGISIPSIKSRALKKEEIKKLIESTNERQAVLIKTLYVTGLRINELTTLEHKSSKKNGNAIELSILGKGKKQRRVMISLNLWNEILKSYPKNEDSNLIFYETLKRKELKKNGKIKRLMVSVKPFQMNNKKISVYLNRLGKLVLNRRLSAQDFRHSFATIKIKEGKPLKAISRYLGHSSTTITSDYYVESNLEERDIFDDEIENVKSLKKNEIKN